MQRAPIVTPGSGLAGHGVGYRAGMANANTSNRATDENDEADGVARFDFAFDLPYRLAAAAFGVREDAASVEVGDDLVVDLVELGAELLDDGGVELDR